MIQSNVVSPITRKLSFKTFFSFSTDVTVSPRSLDFDELKSIRMNESMIIILSYAVALTAFYLFGIFFAQVNFPPIRIPKLIPTNQNN